MKLEEIYLTEKDTEMLSDLLADYNKNLPVKQRKTYQEFAEDLLIEVIFSKHLRLEEKIK